MQDLHTIWTCTRVKSEHPAIINCKQTPLLQTTSSVVNTRSKQFYLTNHTGCSFDSFTDLLHYFYTICQKSVNGSRNYSLGEHKKNHFQIGEARRHAPSQIAQKLFKGNPHIAISLVKVRKFAVLLSNKILNKLSC